MPIPYVLKLAANKTSTTRKPKKNAPPTPKKANEMAKRLASALENRQDATQLTSSSGVIVYQWDNQQNTLVGTFVLALYAGDLAQEFGRKVQGESGQLAGIYAISTHTPTGAIFANGLLIIDAVGNLGAYKVTFILEPTPENLHNLGYVEGTVLFYDALGYLPQGQTQFSVAWDNDVYVRNIGTTTKEWGYRVVTPIT